MQSPLIQSIVDLGDRMHEALIQEDFDAFLQRLSERTALIDSLHEAGPVPPAERKEIASRLVRQQQRLEEALARQETRLSEALTRLTTHRTARRKYSQRPPRRPLLNKNLQG
jgi:hypothetical protein